MGKDTEELHARIGRRITVARGELKLTQHQLSEKLGFKDRQTLQTIEAGRRNLTAEELLKLCEVTGRDMDYYMDPFRLVGEGQFSFRAQGAALDGLTEFEERTGNWIAFWREQGRRQNVPMNPLRQRLALSFKSTYLEAQRAGEALGEALELGDVPSERLVEALENRLELLVLFVDMPRGLSGAACQASGADTILVNRSEPEGRRNFDLAHELFHVLTWESMPPKRVDRAQPSGYKDKHMEILADNFAGGLLMPERLLKPIWSNRERANVSLQDWIMTFAGRFRVSGQAMMYRLLDLHFVSRPDLLDVDEAALRQEPGDAPAPFSRRFMERAARAIERGDVSVMRLWKLLNLTGMGGLKQLFRDHGLPVPFDM